MLARAERYVQERTILATPAYWFTMQIRAARGDRSGALSDASRMLDLSRASGDLQAVGPALAAAAFATFAAGDRDESATLVDELASTLNWGSLWTYYWIAPLGTVLYDLRRGDELVRAAADMTVRTPWLEAGAAAASGDFAGAAAAFDRIGAQPEAAYARLRAGDDVERALDYFRAVRATAYISEAEALLAVERGPDPVPNRLEQLLGVALGHGRETDRKQPNEGRARQEIHDLVEIGFLPELSSLDRPLEQLQQRLSSWTDDPVGIGGCERRVALELTQNRGQDPAEERIGEEAREVADPLEQRGVEVVRFVHVQIRAELADRVGDQFLLAGPAAVDGVSAHAGSRRDGVDRGGLEAARGQKLERCVDDRLVRRAVARPTATASHLGLESWASAPLAEPTSLEYTPLRKRSISKSVSESKEIGVPEHPRSC